MVPIAGDTPESGVRIQIEREKSREAAPWAYSGAAHLPHASYPAEVTVSAEGEVAVTLLPAADGSEAPADLAEKVRLIVRTVYRQAKADDEPPAWRIVRWRGEK